MDYNTGSVLWKKQWDKIHDPATVLGLFEDDESGELVDRLIACNEDKPPASLFLIKYTQECSYKEEGLVNQYISKGYGKYLCPKERFDLIKCLATGIVLGGEEQSIITLLNETPKNHTAALLAWFNADKTGVLKNINSKFQLRNYLTVFKAMQQLYLSGTTQATINAEVKKIEEAFFSDKTREEKAKQNYFTWFEGGILKAMFSTNYVFSRFDEVSIADDGTVSFRYATDPTQSGETTTPISIKPFALLGISVRGNTNEVLEAGNGSMVYVPAIMMPLLISKKENAVFFEALNTMLVATGVGSIVSGGTRFAIVSGGIDVLLGGSALVVDNYKDDILKMQHGEAFLDAYVLANEAFLGYLLGKPIAQLAFAKLSTAFIAFKNTRDFAKLKATNLAKATQIEKEVEQVVKKGELLEKLKKVDGVSGVGSLDDLLKNPAFKAIYEPLENGNHIRKYAQFNVTTAEEASLKLFIRDNYYASFNKALAGEIPMTAEYSAMRDLMVSAHSKLPKQVGVNVFRGAGTAESSFAKGLIKGQKFNFNSRFTSSSIDDYTADLFRRGNGGDVIWQIESKTGVDLKLINSSESEILFKPNTQYELVDIIPSSQIQGVLMYKIKEL